jgi:hypothetical protein
MGFDPQTANQPLVNPHKGTTKVNLSMVAGVVLFFVLTFGYLWWKAHHPGPDAREHPPVVNQH